jgi:hypothetical protein
MAKYGFTKEQVYEALKQQFDPHNQIDANKTPYVKLSYDHEKDIDVINILNRNGVTVEDVKRVGLVSFHGEKIPITKFAIITTWKDEAIKDIGSLEAFNQEYGLQFIAGSKLLLDEKTMNKIINRQIPFSYRPIKPLSERLQGEYLELEWIEDSELFREEAAKNYRIVVTVDLSEGLGQDYTIINIFRLVPKSREEMEVGQQTEIFDFFRLEQIGIYRHNLADLTFVAHILYCIVFEFFDPEKVKIVLEYNTYGESLLSKMPGVFNGLNNYGSFVFLKYYHRADADKPKIGLKVNNNKKMLVKDYQTQMTVGNIVVHESTTVHEIKTFVKEETAAGNLQFHAESGNDDIVMTLVNLSTIFVKPDYKTMVEESMSFDINEELRKYIEEKLGTSQYIKSADYSSLNGMRDGKLPKKRDYRNVQPKTRQLPPKRF